MTFCLLVFQAFLGVPAGAAESPYLLVGTVESKGFTGAVILTPDGKQSFYRLRETLPDGAELVHVHARSISLKGSDGSRYEIFIAAAGKLQTAAAGAPAVTTSPAQPSSDREQKYNPSHRRTHRSSSSEE